MLRIAWIIIPASSIKLPTVHSAECMSSCECMQQSLEQIQFRITSLALAGL